jgi:hypothetical protein
MSNHTPGPWNITADGLNIKSISLDKIIADCDLGEIADIEESRLNARLIAAAPDLLDALQEIWNSSCTNTSIGPSRAAFLKAQKALAKAGGIL